jgi:hypothetical protein
MRSMLGALRDANGLEAMRPWFDGAKDNPFGKGTSDYGLQYEITSALGLSLYGTPPTSLSLNANAPALHAANGSLAGPLFTVRDKATFEKAEMAALIADGQLSIKIGGKILTIAEKDFVEKIKAAAGTNEITGPPVFVDIAPGATVMVTNAYGTIGDTGALNSAQFYVILKE